MLEKCLTRCYCFVFLILQTRELIQTKERKCSKEVSQYCFSRFLFPIVRKVTLSETSINSNFTKVKKTEIFLTK